MMDIFEKIILLVIGFTASCFLIRLGVTWIISVSVPLTIIIAAVIGGITVLRIIKWRNDHRGY